MLTPRCMNGIDLKERLRKMKRTYSEKVLSWHGWFYIAMFGLGWILADIVAPLVAPLL